MKTVVYDREEGKRVYSSDEESKQEEEEEPEYENSPTSQLLDLILIRKKQIDKFFGRGRQPYFNSYYK